MIIIITKVHVIICIMLQLFLHYQVLLKYECLADYFVSNVLKLSMNVVVSGDIPLVLDK